VIRRRIVRSRNEHPVVHNGRIRRDPRAETEASVATDAENILESSTSRPRHDPRADRAARIRKISANSSATAVTRPTEATPVEAAPATKSSGRLRRDPRAPRQSTRSETAERSESPNTHVRDVRIDSPAYIVLAVPDMEGGRLSPHDRDTIAAARELADSGGGAVVVLAMGASADDLAAVGADRIQPTESVAGYAPETRAQWVEAAIAAHSPRHIVFPESAAGGGDLGRRVAASIGERAATHVVRLSAAEVASRAEGRSADWLRSTPRVVLVEQDVAEVRSGLRWEARLLPPLAIHTSAASILDGGLVKVDPNAIPIAEADFIVSAGNGVLDWDRFHDVAAALGASEGGSRVVCDQGHLPKSRQIGASGTLVEPRCYLAFGIAGAPQHLQGITRCERVIAVNTDLHADMIKRADLAIIADAQAVMPALAGLARMRKSS
jgi:electron transfer flavoprotein alpha subunit